MKKGVVLISLTVVGVICLMMLGAVSAEMLLSQPKSLYSLGDELALDITLNPSQTFNDFLDAKLICGGDSVEIYRSPQYVNAGAEKTIHLSATLERNLIGNLEGTCHVESSYGSDTRSSASFEISSEVSVSAQVNDGVADPNQQITLTGGARKANGQMLNGFVRAAIPDMGIDTISTVNNGAFNLSFNIPAHAHPGDYTLTTTAYENENDGVVSNNGNSSTSIRVNQLIGSLDIAFNSANVTPGNELVYTVILKDQADEDMAQDIPVVISQGSSTIKRVLVQSGVAQSFFIGSNYTPGDWKVYAKASSFEMTKVFTVDPLENVSFALANDTLSVINLGNIPYEKSVEVSIGDTKKILDVSLAVGQSERFKLRAPNGNYPISVNDGLNHQLGTAPLTGNAVLISPVSGLSLGISYIWLWVVIIVIVAAIILYYIRNKIPSRNFMHRATLFPTPVRLRSAGSDRETVIEKGHKEKYLVAAVKIKNMEDLAKNESSAPASLDNASEQFKQAKGKVVKEGDFILGIFGAGADKETKADVITAVRAVERTLKEHNRRYARKIEFGIGVHIGELVIDTTSKEFKFTSWGNTVPFAKKLADLANNEAFISEPVRMQLGNKIKAEQVSGSNAWRVKEVIERHYQSQFIDKFMKKQNEENGVAQVPKETKPNVPRDNDRANVPRSNNIPRGNDGGYVDLTGDN